MTTDHSSHITHGWIEKNYVMRRVSEWNARDVNAFVDCLIRVLSGPPCLLKLPRTMISFPAYETYLNLRSLGRRIPYVCIFVILLP